MKLNGCFRFRDTFPTKQNVQRHAFGSNFDEWAN